jgi:hypothetical protein
MEKKDVFSKILAAVGMVLVWIPLLLPVVFCIVSLVAYHRFRFDYLIPAELFPIVLAGGCLLLWAALRTRLFRRLIGWSLGFAIGLLIGSQVLAIVTGLASGETQMAGLSWVLVIVMLIGFWVALVYLGAGGGLLLRTLMAKPRTRIR